MSERLLDAVFFDVDDTLYSSTRFSKLARERAIGAMTAAGLRVSPERLHAVLRDIIVEYHSTYPYQFDELLTRMPRESFEPVNPAMIVAAGVAAYHDTKFRELKAYEDVLEVIKVLDNTDLILGIISAGITIKQIEKLIRAELLEYISPNNNPFTARPQCGDFEKKTQGKIALSTDAISFLLALFPLNRFGFSPEFPLPIQVVLSFFT